MVMKHYEQLSTDDYQQICSALNISPETDLQAAKIMHSMLSSLAVRKTFKKLKTILKNKIILIFAPGPSLKNSLEQLYNFVKNTKNEVLIIAVDGAAQALMEIDVKIDVIITDLDGSISAIRESFLTGSIIVVHAHGDNIAKINEIKDIIPEIGLLGTTQTNGTTKVKNLGGFTDGDRAAYLAANLGGRKIILIGYDFGNVVGRFSKPENKNEDFQASKRKLTKFVFAKKLLSKLPCLFPKIGFYNYSKFGEEIENIPRIEIKEIKELLNYK